MKPTLLVGDKIIVSKMSYGYSKYSIPFALVPFEGRIFEKNPVRGDIVVFKLPSDKRTNYVKRVIGLPGDKIQMKNGVLYINNTSVKMLQLNNFNDNENINASQYIETLTNGAAYNVIDYGDFFYDNTEEFTVPEDHYFFMGDNRDNSQDSRTTELGFVHKDLLLGKVKRVLISSQHSLFNVFMWHKIRFDRFFLNPYISQGVEEQPIATPTTVIENEDEISKIITNS